MAESKPIGLLLKELNDMQIKFDNLNEELIIKKTKKKSINTNLASKNIDTDFFKTLTAPKKKEVIEKKHYSTKKTTSKNSNLDDDMFFSLEGKYEKDKVTIKKETPKSIPVKPTINKTSIPTQEKTIPKTPIQQEVIKEKPVQKNSNSNDAKTPTKDNSEQTYLSIKEKLDKIKTEIALREGEMKKGGINAVQPKKTQIVKPKLNSDILSTENKPAKESKPVTVKENKSVKKIVQPIKKEPISITKEPVKVEHKIKSVIKQDKKASEKSSETINKNNSVDKLTIIILVLLVVLIGSAWFLLK